MPSNVCVTACFENLCSDEELNLDPNKNFALIRLVTPKNYEGMVYDEVNDKYYPCDHVWRTNFDPGTACFTTCPLPCNSNLNVKDVNGNPATYYEIVIFINGKSCGAEKFTLDCDINDYPDPASGCLNLADVTWVSPGSIPSPFHCALVKDCETPWIGEDSNCIKITSGDNPDGNAGNGHKPKFDLVISELPGNILTCTNDGLFALSKQTFVTVSDGACIDMAISGSGDQVDPYVISAAPIISGVGDNLLTCTPTGLYASPSQVTVIGEDCLELSVSGSGAPSDPYSIFGKLNISLDAENIISCTNDGLFAKNPYITTTSSNCVTLTVEGSGTESDPFNFHPEIVISGNLDNLLTCASDGLLITCEDVQDCVGAGFTNGLYYDDVTNTYNVRISGDATNQLSFGSDQGLFVPSVDGSETQVSAAAPSGCFTPIVSGLGTTANPYLVGGSIEISGLADNALACRPDGLYAPITALSSTNNSCFALALDGAGTILDPYDLEGTVIVSPSPTNALTCTASGLYAPIPTGAETRFGVQSNNCFALALDGSGTESDPYLLEGNVVVSTNADNLLSCSPSGLLLTCEQVQDCVGHSLTQGLVYDDVANTMSVRVSGDARNCLSFGSDSGLYVECADGSETKILGLDTYCASTDVAGAGTTIDPYKVSVSPIISAVTDNAISCTPGGLYSQKYALQTANTNCIDLNLVGDGSLASPWVASAHLKISNSVDNLVNCTASGLELTCEQVQDCVGSGFATGLRYDDATNTYHARISSDSNNAISFGIDGGLFAPRYDGSETKLQVADGSCFDFTLIGNGTLASPYVISGSPIIQVPDPDTLDCSCDNWLKCTPGGLYVSAPQLDTISTDCITLTVSGDASCTTPWELTADINISSDDDNILECTPDGLRVLPPVVDGSETKLQVANTNCVSLSLTGTGTSVNPYLLTPYINISSNDNNIVKCLSNGLFAEKTFVEGDPTDCISTVVTGAGTEDSPYLIRVAPILSSDPLNALECTVDGLLVSPTSLTTTNSSCIELNLSGVGDSTDPFNITAYPVISTVDNLLKCTSSGLSVTCEDVQDCVGQGFTNGLAYNDVSGTFYVKISGNVGNAVYLGTDDGIYVPVADGSETKVQVTSGNCITSSIVGSGTTPNPYIIHSDINLDIRPDNIAMCTEDGLFVPSSLLELDIVDSNCIDLALTGVGTYDNPYKLSSQLILDTVADNMLTCSIDGLRLRCEEIQDCIGDAFGSGLAYDDVNNVFSARVSGDAGNCIQYGTDYGLYAPCADGSETKVEVLSGDCLDLAISGSGQSTEPYIISGDIKVSTFPGNLLECTPDGLYISNNWSCEAIQDCVGSGFTSGLTYDDVNNQFRVNVSNDFGNVLSFGSDQGLYVPTSELIKFTSYSTDCITLEIDGAGTVAEPFTLQATPRIKVASGSECENLLECTPEGLYVPAPTFDVVGSDCLSIAVSGDGTCADGYVITADVIVSPALDNTLSCSSVGLYVPAPDGSETKLQVGDTSCIDLSIIGSGTSNNPYVVTADIEISVDPNNSISCRSNGLYVEETFIEGIDTNCISSSITGLGTYDSPYLASSSIVLSETQGNLLECYEDGLFAPATVIEAVDNNCIKTDITGLGTTDSPYEIEVSAVISPDLNNLLSCTPTGLALTCESVQDCVGDGFTSGLIYDDVTNTFKAHFSGDIKNIISLGSDGGLFVPSVHVEGIDNPCMNVEVTGCGTPDEPLVIDVMPIISNDDCNILECTENGLKVPKIISFEIGQQCSLSQKPAFPYLWRAYETGYVSFKVAGLPMFSANVVDADTHFEIIDKNGNTVYADSIPYQEEFKLLDLPMIPVNPGDAFGVIAATPYAPTPAEGIIVQAEFICGEA